MAWWLASLVANAAIILTEAVNRSGLGWSATFVRTLPLIAAAQAGLYLAFRGAPSWLVAWTVFTLGNSAMRVAMVRFTADGEISSWPLVACGIAAMTVGALILKEGLA